MQKTDSWIDLRLEVYRVTLVQKCGGLEDESTIRIFEETDHRTYITRDGSEALEIYKMVVGLGMN